MVDDLRNVSLEELQRLNNKVQELCNNAYNQGREDEKRESEKMKILYRQYVDNSYEQGFNDGFDYYCNNN